MISMPLPFLTRYSLEFAHVRGVDGRPDDGQVVDLRGLLVSLIVLEEELQVLHVLELDVSEVDRRAVQLVGRQYQVLRAHHGVRLVKVKRVWQVLEDPHCFGPLVRWRFDFDRVYLYSLKEVRMIR